MPDKKTSLSSLPDEIIVDIIDHLDTAGDVALLSSLSRRTHSVVQQDGWRTFVKRQFPSLSVSADTITSVNGNGIGVDAAKWSALAERLTYLDRCWDKRGIFLRVFHGKADNRGRRRGRRPGQQSVRFHPVVDACLLTPACSTGQEDELLAWGAGEELIARRRTGRSMDFETWNQLRGSEAGYAPGTGDITAISVLERQDTPQVVVGRANGDLHVLSAAAKDFGRPMLRLFSLAEDYSYSNGTAPPSTSPLRKSPGQTAISWTEWDASCHLLAACRSSVLTLYDLSVDGEGGLEPLTSCDAAAFNKDPEETCTLRSVKFMGGGDIMACALGGSKEPLRWAKLLSTGVELYPAADHRLLIDDLTSKTDIEHGEKTTVRAIETIGHAGNGNLLLSAWDDGTYRLMDIRTPSPYDTIYRDQFQPYHAGSALLTYGLERFIAGSNEEAALRFFDFRWPKAYQHTAAQSCSSEMPFPKRYFGRDADTPRGTPPPPQQPGQSRPHLNGVCEPRDGHRCTWHYHSSAHTWRPDATLNTGNTVFESISSLAKTGDSSERFYCGVRGGIMEANMALVEDWKPFLRPARWTAPQGWVVGSERGETRLIETGTSLCASRHWKGPQGLGIPTLMYHEHPFALPEGKTAWGEGLRRSRLDAAWRDSSGAHLT